MVSVAGNVVVRGSIILEPRPGLLLTLGFNSRLTVITLYQVKSNYTTPQLPATHLTDVGVIAIMDASYQSVSLFRQV